MSDVHFMLNDWALPKMSAFGVRCAGHEGAGVVVKLGKAVKGWKVGDRAGIKPILDVCHNCEECWNGRRWMVRAGVVVGEYYADSQLCRRELLSRRHPYRSNGLWHLPTVSYIARHLYFPNSGWGRGRSCWADYVRCPLSCLGHLSYRH